MSDDMLEAITPKLLNQRPNTYTFAKALAESQLQEDAQGLPVIVGRFLFAKITLLKLIKIHLFSSSVDHWRNLA
jgi:hypothetical protein